MNQLFRATGLFLLLSSPLIVSAKTPAPSANSAWQQTWRLARQHFPALQAAEFDMVGQAGAQRELEAFAHSKYTFRDAEILASFWKEGLDESKAHIGRKVLFGGASVDAVDQDLRAGRAQALASVNQLRFFNESYTMRDAEALARFWGERGPFDAKLRLERKVILGEEAIVQADLQRALTSNIPAPQPPQGNPAGSLTNLTPAPGQSVANRKPDVSANFSSRPQRNSVVLLVDSIDRTQESTFSPNEQFLRWTPSQDLAFGNHAVELRAIGQNGETFARTWTFSIPGSRTPGQGTGGSERFFDSQQNFGLDIPPGWQRQALGANILLRLNKNGSTFEVAASPAQDPQATIAAARNQLTQHGAQILNQFPTQLSGMSATRIDYSLPRERRFGQMVICVTSHNQSFLVGAESRDLNSFPISQEVKSMFQSFLINDH